MQHRLARYYGMIALIKLFPFIYLYSTYALWKTLNCPGNFEYGFVSFAFDSTYLLASGSSDKRAQTLRTAFLF
jgi:hypothetical protein